jgi:Listeria-Bacteroides repeat domain (List_Bact_rpt).
MKNWKQFTFVAFIVIVGVIIGFMACDSSGNNDPETFAVTFNANGGMPQPPTQTVTKGGKVDEPTITKANNKLDGWYTESSFTTKWNFATDTVTAVIALHAKWLCNCPNGTLHLVGEMCCEGVGCNCEKNVVGQRVDGIPVTSRGGDHTKAIANVTEAFGWLTEEELTIIKDYVRDIQVRSGNGMGAGAENFSKQDGKYIIKIEELSISEGIYYALWDVTEEVSGN